MKKNYGVVTVLFCIWVITAIALAFRPSSSIEILPEQMAWDTETGYGKYVQVDNQSMHYACEETIAEATGYQSVGCYAFPKLKWGVYNLEADYTTQYQTSADQLSPVVHLQMTGGNPSKYQAEDLSLFSYKNKIYEPIWVNTLTGVSGTYLYVNVTGAGNCDIYSLRLVENPLWKVGFLFAEALVFALFVYWYYVGRNYETKRRFQVLAIIAVVIFTSYPALYVFPNALKMQYDFSFHISRIASIANELHYGHFPALYQSDAYNGYGYLSLIMYGNLFLYVPAIMHLLGMPLTTAYNVYSILTNLLTCLIALYSFKGIFKKDKYAYVGMALYMLSMYRISNIYVRASVGEYTAMAFLPLVIYGFYRIYFTEGKLKLRDLMPVVLGMTGVIQSHTLMIEMIAVYVVLFILLQFKRTAQKMVELVEALVMILLLNAGFIIPFLDGYKQALTVNSKQIADNLLPSGAYFYQLFGVFTTHSGWNVENSSVEEMPLALGFSLVLGMLLFCMVCIGKKKWIQTETEKRNFWLVAECFGFGCVALWLSSAYFPWGYLYGVSNRLVLLFTSIQFPWRYLAMATLFMVIVTVYAIQVLDQAVFDGIEIAHIGRKLSIGLIAVAIVIAGHFFTYYTDAADSAQVLAMTANTKLDELYLPAGTNPGAMTQFIPLGYSEGEIEIRNAGTSESNARLFSVSKNTVDSLAILPVLYYDYIRVYDQDTKEPLSIYKGDNNCVAVNLPAGYTGTLVCTYQVSMIWKLGYILSVISVIVLLIIGVRSRRKA